MQETRVQSLDQRRSHGEGNSNLLHYSYLENPMGRRAWWATVHGVTKSWTQLSDFTTTTSTEQLLHAKHCSVLHVVTHFILTTSLSAIPGIIPVLQKKKSKHWEVRSQVTRLGCGWAGLRASCPVFPTTTGTASCPFWAIVLHLMSFFFFNSFTFFFQVSVDFKISAFLAIVPGSPSQFINPDLHSS